LTSGSVLLDRQTDTLCKPGSLGSDATAAALDDGLQNPVSRRAVGHILRRFPPCSLEHHEGTGELPPLRVGPCFFEQEGHSTLNRRGAIMVHLLSQTQGFGSLTCIDFDAHGVHRDIRRPKRRPGGVALTGPLSEGCRGPHALPSRPQIAPPHAGDRPEQCQRAAQRRSFNIVGLYERSERVGASHSDVFGTFGLPIGKQHVGQIPAGSSKAVWIVGSFGRPDRPVRHEQGQIAPADPLGDRA
jgi:hypothetical protein